MTNAVVKQFRQRYSGKKDRGPVENLISEKGHVQKLSLVENGN